MIHELEIIDLNSNESEKEKLNINYPLYIRSYVEVIKIFLQNVKNYSEHNEKQCNIYLQKEDYPNNMDNVITIVGKRGSGKTTAMQEILSVFLQFNDYKREWMCKVGEPYASELKSQIDKHFVVETMEIVDASVLEEKDDLLEIILWYMCNQVKQMIEKEKNINRTKISNRDIQEFLDVVDEVYRMHQNVKGKRREEGNGESVLTILQNMPNSIRTRQSMNKLIDKYFQILYPGKSENAYLIIAIDDLDLNIKKGHQMLEEIRRYLLHWKIVILLAVDYEQMEKVVEKYYCTEFAWGQWNTIDKELKKHINKLSNSYMIKVFPILNRIYLPENAIKTSLIIEKNNKYTIKQYLILKIYQKMHILYDASGLKTHFCELTTIRELISYSKFLDSLNDVEWLAPIGIDKQQYIRQQLDYYNQNCERFIQDIIERMAFQLLSSQQRVFFYELLKRDLERQVGYVLFGYKNTKEKKAIMEAMAEYEDYTYGEFLGCMYEWGRKNYEYKPLVHCLLALFTSEMTKEYFNYLYNTDKEVSNNSKRYLQKFMGDSIAGGWLAEGLGDIYIDVYEKKDKTNINLENENSKENEKVQNSEQTQSVKMVSPIAYVKDKNLKYLEFSFIVSVGEEEEATYNRFLTVMKFYEENNILPILECVLMCLNNFRIEENGRKCSPQIIIDAENNDKNTWKIIVNIIGAKFADVDILGFVKQSLDYKCWKMEITETLKEQLIKWAMRISGIDKAVEYENVKLLTELFEKTSMFHKRGNNGTMAIPLYNVDISYNILKRVRRECMREYMAIKSNDIIERISSIYMYIENELKREVSDVKKGGNEDIDIEYADIFRKDPYIVKFRELANHEKSSKLLKEQLVKFYRSPYKLEAIPNIFSNERND